MTTTPLKERLHALQDQLQKPEQIRIHRALSWLARAEQEVDDPDARFLFLWIAFNAAYAKELGADEGERQQLAAFFDAVVMADPERQLHQLLFERYSGVVRVLVGNRYVFEPFWRALREHDGTGRWEEQFQASQRAAHHAILMGDTRKVLAIVFDRLYVLRNQLVHGGATWNSSVNRQQVKDGASLMGSVVPLLLDLMMTSPALSFGEVNYPVV